MEKEGEEGESDDDINGGIDNYRKSFEKGIRKVLRENCNIIFLQN